jgi:hypothetical protein
VTFGKFFQVLNRESPSFFFPFFPHYSSQVIVMADTTRPSLADSPASATYVQPIDVQYPISNDEKEAKEETLAADTSADTQGSIEYGTEPGKDTFWTTYGLKLVHALVAAVMTGWWIAGLVLHRSDLGWLIPFLVVRILQTIAHLESE